MPETFTVTTVLLRLDCPCCAAVYAVPKSEFPSDDGKPHPIPHHCPACKEDMFEWYDGMSFEQQVNKLREMRDKALEKVKEVSAELDLVKDLLAQRDARISEIGQATKESLNVELGDAAIRVATALNAANAEIEELKDDVATRNETIDRLHAKITNLQGRLVAEGKAKVNGNGKIKFSSGATLTDQRRSKAIEFLRDGKAMRGAELCRQLEIPIGSLTTTFNHPAFAWNDDGLLVLSEVGRQVASEMNVPRIEGPADDAPAAEAEMVDTSDLPEPPEPSDFDDEPESTAEERLAESDVPPSAKFIDLIYDAVAQHGPQSISSLCRRLGQTERDIKAALACTDKFKRHLDGYGRVCLESDA